MPVFYIHRLRDTGNPLLHLRGGHVREGKGDDVAPCEASLAGDRRGPPASDHFALPIP